MPEGPEIRKAADKIALAVLPFAVTDIYFAFKHLKTYEKRLKGQRVTKVETRGKAMLIHFSNRLSIYSHNQLYGKWMIRKAYNYPKTKRQLRLAIHNENKSALLYSASDIQVLTPAQITEHPFLSVLGPDILSVEPRHVHEQLESNVHMRRQFSSLFLDQHFLAGVGNYLRSEILFVARLHPRLRPIDCSTNELADLAEAAVRVSCQSYRHKGITNDLIQAEKLKAEGQTRKQYRHWVFGRENQPCRICNESVVKDIASSRRIYYCPICQPYNRLSGTSKN